jgi:hypothetical protein
MRLKNLCRRSVSRDGSDCHGCLTKGGATPVVKRAAVVDGLWLRRWRDERQGSAPLGDSTHPPAPWFAPDPATRYATGAELSLVSADPPRQERVRFPPNAVTRHKQPRNL